METNATSGKPITTEVYSSQNFNVLTSNDLINESEFLQFNFNTQAAFMRCRDTFRLMINFYFDGNLTILDVAQMLNMIPECVLTFTRPWNILAGNAKRPVVGYTLDRMIVLVQDYFGSLWQAMYPDHTCGLHFTNGFPVINLDTQQTKYGSQQVMLSTPSGEQGFGNYLKDVSGVNEDFPLLESLMTEATKANFKIPGWRDHIEKGQSYFQKAENSIDRPDDFRIFSMLELMPALKELIAQYMTAHFADDTGKDKPGAGVNDVQGQNSNVLLTDSLNMTPENVPAWKIAELAEMNPLISTRGWNFAIPMYKILNFFRANLIPNNTNMHISMKFDLSDPMKTLSVINHPKATTMPTVYASVAVSYVDTIGAAVEETSEGLLAPVPTEKNITKYAAFRLKSKLHWRHISNTYAMPATFPKLLMKKEQTFLTWQMFQIDQGVNVSLQATLATTGILASWLETTVLTLPFDGNFNDKYFNITNPGQSTPLITIFTVRREAIGFGFDPPIPQEYLAAAIGYVEGDPYFQNVEKFQILNEIQDHGEMYETIKSMESPQMAQQFLRFVRRNCPQKITPHLEKILKTFPPAPDQNGRVSHLSLGNKYESTIFPPATMTYSFPYYITETEIFKSSFNTVKKYRKPTTDLIQYDQANPQTMKQQYAKRTMKAASTEGTIDYRQARLAMDAQSSYKGRSIQAGSNNGFGADVTYQTSKNLYVIVNIPSRHIPEGFTALNVAGQITTTIKFALEDANDPEYNTDDYEFRLVNVLLTMKFAVLKANLCQLSSTLGLVGTGII
ncbi:MAG: hypothetical protein GY900_12510 [Actinomycetia bacterium]|nr:hypothetical protein [Actinomycetes bacterium]